MTITKVTLLGGILTFCALGQPPAMIRVVRNGAVHLYQDARVPINHDSFGSIEDLDKALSAVTQPDLSQQGTPLSADEVLSPSKTLIAQYRPGLSYRPDQAIQSLPKMRYFDVTLYHIRPGTESDFARFLKLRNAGLDSRKRVIGEAGR